MCTEQTCPVGLAECLSKIFLASSLVFLGAKLCLFQWPKTHLNIRSHVESNVILLKM